MKTKLEETITIRGCVKHVLRDKNGKIKFVRVDKNLVVTAGKNYLAAWLAAASQATPFMGYVGLGTGSTSPAAGDTALGTEFSGGGYSRQAGALSAAGNVWQSISTFGAGNGTGAITEAGLFSASSAGSMMARQTFAAYNKQATDSLQITWTLTFN